MSEIRLDRYLARIGLDAAPPATLAGLVALQAAHVHAIPFEGLDPFLGRPVRLDLQSLQDKLVGRARGGYCFEQNGLFKAVLEALGFKVTGLSGRVVWMSPPDVPLGPRVHMLLRVELPEGPFLADVGFGACLLDQPLRFEPHVEQRTEMGTFRLEPRGTSFALQARQPTGWRSAYVFDGAPQLPADYELGNWYTSTHPSVPFTNLVILERLAPGKRHKLVNLRYVVEGREGGVLEEHTLAGPDALANVLTTVFGIEPPVAASDLFARIEALPQPTAR